jgi:hypothetical protein
MSKGMPHQEMRHSRKPSTERAVALNGKPERTPPGAEVCRDCGAVHFNDRWYLADNAPLEAFQHGRAHETLCPACRQIQGHSPVGTLTLSGAFLIDHRQEIMNLIKHADRAARNVNPMERIVETRQPDDHSIFISATNDFLVQRLGKAIRKAYDGELEIKFGGRNSPVRVYWHRD